MPPKKNTIESEIKKKNKKSAESIVKMLQEEKSDVEDGAMPPPKKGKDTLVPRTRKVSGTDKSDSKRSIPKGDVQRASKGENPSSSKIGEKTVAKKNSADKGKSVRTFRYEIDCQRVKDSVDVKNLEQYVTQQLKVNGKKDNLNDNVTVRCVGDSVVITSKVYLPKKSLRYLSKKFLKKVWNVQVVSKTKNSYELKYVGTS